MADGAMGTVPWTIKGELILNCNCTVFCPCVVSLGKHPPTEGYCQAWVGIRIDEGQYGDASLKGLNIVGGDVVEVAPQYDATSNTAQAGAQMMFTILSLIDIAIEQRRA